MTCNVYLYHTDIKLNSKNYVLDNMEQYLASSQASLVYQFIDYQYQRFTLETSFKFAISQDYQTYKFVVEPNYIKVTTIVNNETLIYYYFITKMTQKANMTIECECVMDTLNTFHYGSYNGYQNNYSLKRNTLVLREHKNRLLRVAGDNYSIIPMNSTQQEIVDFWLNADSGSGSEYGDSPWIALDLQALINYIQETRKADYGGISSLIASGDTSNPSWIEGIEVLSPSLQGSQIIASIYINSDHITFRDKDGNAEFVSFDELYPYSNNKLIFRFLVGELVDDWYPNTQLIDSSVWTQIIGFFERYTAVQNASKYYRIIDKFNEGIDTMLFKKREEYLTTGDGFNSWYLVYKNTNAPAQSGDKEADYVNPVKLFITSDNGYTITQTSSQVTEATIWASELPMKTNVEELLYINKNMCDSSDGEVTFNGTTYKIVAYSSSYNTNEYNAILFRHKNNSDGYFREVFGYRYNANGVFQSCTSLGTTIQKFTARHIIYGLIEYASIWTGGASYSELVKGAGTSAYYEIGSGASPSTETLTAKRFNEIDLTDSKLIKIIMLPYAPLSLLDKSNNYTQVPSETTWNNTEQMLEVSNPSLVSFDWNQTFTLTKSPYSPLVISGEVDNPLPNVIKNKKYESKLFHSDYWLPKFVYDEYTFGFRLELVDRESYIANYGEEIDNFTMNYHISKNLVSRFMFTFFSYITTGYEEHDYNNIVIVDRNNEIPLYTNAYMNYMRLGYQFDTKNIQQTKTSNALTMALSLIGSIVSFATSGATGGAGIAGGVALLTSATASGIRAITSAQQQDSALIQKQLELQNQSTTVSTNTDTDLLKKYALNKPKLAYYGLSEVMEEAMFNYFYLFGYATQEYKVPSVHTREIFNFIQAEVQFDRYNFNDDIAEDIRQKWKDGIFFIHYYNTKYDFSFYYENWETNF